MVFEGIDKCGKSTQIELLAKRWAREGRRVVLTREPGGTVLGEKIRRLLLDQKGDVSPLAELFLYEASRAHHVSRKILPALSEGRIVLSDRFTLATFAYQAAGRGIPWPTTRSLNRLASFAVEADLTVVLDVSVEEALKRMGTKRDRMEADPSFLEKARRAYLQQSRRLPRIKVIPGTDSIEIIHRRVVALADAYLKASAAK